MTQTAASPASDSSFDPAAHSPLPTSHATDYETIARERRSVRGFKPDPVPKELIEELITIAKQAPSSMNTQPWHFRVVTGNALEQIREGNTERNLAGVPPSREITSHGRYEGIHRDRQKQIAVDLYNAMGIEWGDKERRQDWVVRGYRQFDAPVSVIVTIDKSLENSPTAHFDAGAAAYGLVLAAWSRGLGCVTNGQGITHSPVVRAHANIPEDEIIVTTVAMGWPDEDFAANHVKAVRADNDSVVSYAGFE